MKASSPICRYLNPVKYRLVIAVLFQKCYKLFSDRIQVCQILNRNHINLQTNDKVYKIFITHLKTITIITYMPFFTSRPVESLSKCRGDSNQSKGKKFHKKLRQYSKYGNSTKHTNLLLCVAEQTVVNVVRPPQSRFSQSIAGFTGTLKHNHHIKNNYKSRQNSLRPSPIKLFLARVSCDGELVK